MLKFMVFSVQYETGIGKAERSGRGGGEGGREEESEARS